MLKKFLDHFEEIFGAVALFIMAAITFANVITRYVVHYPLSFTEEITINFFVWIVMAGAAIAFRKNSNLAMTFIYDLFPQKIRLCCFAFSSIVILGFFGLLTWLSTQQVLADIDLEATSEALGVPSWYYSIAVPVFSVLVIFRYCQAARKILAERSY